MGEIKKRMEVMIRLKDGKILYYDENAILAMNYAVKNKENKFDENGEMSSIHIHDSVYTLTLKLKIDVTNYKDSKELRKNEPINIAGDLEKSRNLPFGLYMLFEVEYKKNICIIITETIKDNIILRIRTISEAEVVYYREKFNNYGVSNESEIAFKAKIT